MTEINAKLVNDWASKYNVDYDKKYYEPYIIQARNGDEQALRRVTEWKNVSRYERPMKLSATKEKAFQKLIVNLKNYRGDNGSQKLRNDFSHNAPVWSIFWHHVLFQTPIFDVFTHIAFHYDKTGQALSKSSAVIKAPGHWELYDQYQEWFDQTLKRLKKEDDLIKERKLDRALMSYGQELSKHK